MKIFAHPENERVWRQTHQAPGTDAGERSNTMFQRMVVPLDGSPRAERAIPVAARLARASGGTVVLLRVAGLPTAFVPSPSADPWTIQTIIDADVVEAKRYLQDVARLHHLTGVRVETEVVVGAAATAILSVAKARHVDLIVLCSHGYTGMKRWVLGSVAEQVARYAPVPVLLLREGGPALVGTPPHAEGPLRALVPLDGSVYAREALVPAAQLIAALAAPGPCALHLSRVVVLPESAQISQSEREAILREAKQYLSATVDQLREGLLASPAADLKLAITWSVTTDDDIAAGILRVAEEGEEAHEARELGRSDLIAMVTHGSSGLPHWAMGSVTERVLHATSLPLLIVRPAEVTDRGQQAQDRAAMQA
jgi:nucleotide-binding universal stress UspA family protein